MLLGIDLGYCNLTLFQTRGPKVQNSSFANISMSNCFPSFIVRWILNFVDHPTPFSKQEALRCKTGCFCYLYMENLFIALQITQMALVIEINWFLNSVIWNPGLSAKQKSPKSYYQGALCSRRIRRIHHLKQLSHRNHSVDRLSITTTTIKFLQSYMIWCCRCCYR
jgi:hypothetical protein